MITTATLLLATLATPPATPPVRTLLARVGPAPAIAQAPRDARSPGQDRAVVLIHGLALHPLSTAKVGQAAFRHWQQPGSALVRPLAEDSDVWSVGYSQTSAVENVAAAVAALVKKVKAQGYKEVVLVGHSAGGLIARQLVEDHPDAGVTKVVQVCAPNLGST